MHSDERSDKGEHSCAPHLPRLNVATCSGCWCVMRVLPAPKTVNCMLTCARALPACTSVPVHIRPHLSQCELVLRAGPYETSKLFLVRATTLQPEASYRDIQYRNQVGLAQASMQRRRVPVGIMLCPHTLAAQ